MGGRIARFLMDCGWQVTLASSRRARLPQWADGMQLITARFPLDEIPGDLCEAVDAIVHLAAPNEIQSQSDPAYALAATAIGTWQLLQAAKQHNVQRFLYLSTIHVYGAPLEGRIDEDRLPRPIHPYAIAHRAAEDYVLAALRQREVDGAVVRLSNAVGAPTHADIDRWTLLVNDLCLQASKGSVIKLRSAGLQRRDFIPLTDVARAVAHLLDAPRDALAGGLFNLGGEMSLTVAAMAATVAERCEKVLGRRLEIQRPQPAPGEASPPLDYRIDRLRATGFTLSSSLEAEIDATLQFCAGLSPST